MFCSLCRQFDIKQNDKTMAWNSTANVRCRTQTSRDHFSKPTSMHQEAVEASKRREKSYFDRKKEAQIDNLKNDVYFRIFHSLYWLAKEEIASVKCLSLLSLLERMGVKELKYFETRSEASSSKNIPSTCKNYHR